MMASLIGGSNNVPSATTGSRRGTTRGRPSAFRAVFFLETICVSLWFAGSVYHTRRLMTAPSIRVPYPETVGCPEVWSNHTIGQQARIQASRDELQPQRQENHTLFLQETRRKQNSSLPALSMATQVAKPQPTQDAPRVFTCGYDDMGYVGTFTIFSDFKSPGNYIYRCLGHKRTITARPDDVIVYGMHGVCGDYKNNLPGLLKVFPGKVLFLNGESFGNVQDFSPSSRQRVYQLGPYIQQQAWQQHTMQLYFLVIAYYRLPHDKQEKITNHTLKPKNKHAEQRQGFAKVAYFTSNCVSFRQQAARDIGEIISLHYSLGCQVPNATLAELAPKPHKLSKGKHSAFSNDEFYQRYKYCLVMENKNYPGYITEKILNAYLGGCIPIYYGTEEVFKLFHKDSFVFYNANNPQPALDQLLHLERNQSAYNDMLYNAPILAGPTVLEEYFSLSDRIGGGKLKRQIREMMGISNTSTTSAVMV